MGSVSAAVVNSVPRGKPNMSSTPDIILAREGTGGERLARTVTPLSLGSSSKTSGYFYTKRSAARGRVPGPNRCSRYLDQFVKLGEVLVGSQHRAQILAVVCHGGGNPRGQAQRRLQPHCCR